MDSQPDQSKGYTNMFIPDPVLPPRGHVVTMYYSLQWVSKCERCAPSQLGWLTDGVGPQTVGLNSPRCHTLRSSRDLVSIYEILRQTVSARNFYQSESRWFDIWEPAFTEFYFRLHRRRTNVYFIKISACHNIIFILRTIQDQGRKVCTV